MFRENEREEAEKDTDACLVCPYCYTLNKSNPAEHVKAPKCMKCGRPLTGQAGVNGNMMKCLDCLMGMETPDGVWCVRFRGLVNEEILKKCREFISKDTMHSKESGQV